MASKGNVLQFPTKSEEAANFKVFAKLVAVGELKKAAEVLAKLLDVDSQAAEKACLHFTNLFIENPSNVIAETMQVRQSVLDGDQNGALMLLQKVFGLSGGELIIALEAVKKIG